MGSGSDGNAPERKQLATHQAWVRFGIAHHPGLRTRCRLVREGTRRLLLHTRCGPSGGTGEGDKKYAPSGRNLRGRTSLCAAWSMLLECCRSLRCVSCDPRCFDWRRFSACVVVREDHFERLRATLAAPAGTVIQLISHPFIGNGRFRRKCHRPKTTAGAVQAFHSSHNTLRGVECLAGYRSRSLRG